MNCTLPTRQPAHSVMLRAGCPLVIALAVFLCFRPVLRNEFVNWDDVQGFEENLSYRGLYSYVACLPFAVLVAAAIHQLDQALQSGRAGRAVCCTVATVVAAVLIALGGATYRQTGATYRQTQVWHDSLTLWNHVLAVEPMNYIAYNNRAWVHSRGDFAGALADASAAVRLDPQYALAYLNRGKARWATGDRTPPGDSSRPALERRLAALRQEITTAAPRRQGQQ